MPARISRPLRLASTTPSPPGVNVVEAEAPGGEQDRLPPFAAQYGPDRVPFGQQPLVQASHRRPVAAADPVADRRPWESGRSSGRPRPDDCLGCGDYPVVPLGTSWGDSDGCWRGGGPGVAPRDIRESVKATKDIRETVQKELEFDPLVDATDITVKNLNGKVALNGTVPSYPQYLQAAAAAKRVKGVTRVHNHLMVVLPPADYRDDAMLTTAANNALALNITVPARVEASASDGDVWLTGMVSNRFERDAAAQAIAGLPGLRDIINDIEILSEVETTDVTLLVEDALDRYSLIPDGSDIAVEASDGTVKLTGHVRNWAEHDMVIDAAWKGVGVKNVNDELVVTS